MATPPSPFGFLTPGRPFTCNFVSTDGLRFVIDVPLPCDNFALTLLTTDVPPGHGFGCYWAVSPFANWQYLGPLVVENPTAFFQSPWALSDPLASLDPALASAHPPSGIQVGVSLETLDFLSNLQGSATSCKVPERSSMADAAAIASNLVRPLWKVFPWIFSSLSHLLPFVTSRRSIISGATARFRPVYWAQSMPGVLNLQPN